MNENEEAASNDGKDQESDAFRADARRRSSQSRIRGQPKQRQRIQERLSIQRGSRESLGEVDVQKESTLPRTPEETHTPPMPHTPQVEEETSRSRTPERSNVEEEPPASRAHEKDQPETGHGRSKETRDPSRQRKGATHSKPRGQKLHLPQSSHDDEGHGDEQPWTRTRLTSSRASSRTARHKQSILAPDHEGDLDNHSGIARPRHGKSPKPGRQKAGKYTHMINKHHTDDGERRASQLDTPQIESSRPRGSRLHRHSQEQHWQRASTSHSPGPLHRASVDHSLKNDDKVAARPSVRQRPSSAHHLLARTSVRHRPSSAHHLGEGHLPYEIPHHRNAADVKDKHFKAGIKDRRHARAEKHKIDQLAAKNPFMRKMKTEAHNIHEHHVHPEVARAVKSDGDIRKSLAMVNEDDEDCNDHGVEVLPAPDGDGDGYESEHHDENRTDKSDDDNSQSVVNSTSTAMVTVTSSCAFLDDGQSQNRTLKAGRRRHEERKPIPRSQAGAGDMFWMGNDAVEVQPSRRAKSPEAAGWSPWSLW